nr:hypothetical protein SBE_002643 [Streptomyces sp. SBE_14.2]
MLRATAWTHGRQGALIGASAAVVCLGGLLAACGGSGGGDDGYTAVGAPGATARTAGPTGTVTLVPLVTAAPGAPAASNSASGGGTSAGSTGRTSGGARSVPSGGGGAKTGGTGASSAPVGRTTSAAPSTTTAPTATPGKPSPADLSWSQPERAEGEQRWCEEVTVRFHNSGGAPVRSGTVTLGTHIIGALGVDWGTVESQEELPAPIGGGARKERTWTVCVDRFYEGSFLLGAHMEHDVTVTYLGGDPIFISHTREKER